LHPLENSYSEKSIASWFSFLQTGPRDPLAMLEQLLDQVGLKEVLDGILCNDKNIFVFMNDNLTNYLMIA